MSKPNLPTRPTHDVTAIKASWICKLLDCIDYAMNYPKGDSSTIFNNGGLLSVPAVLRKFNSKTETPPEDFLFKQALGTNGTPTEEVEIYRTVLNEGKIKEDEYFCGTYSIQSPNTNFVGFVEKAKIKLTKVSGTSSPDPTREKITLFAEYNLTSKKVEFLFEKLAKPVTEGVSSSGMKVPMAEMFLRETFNEQTGERSTVFVVSRIYRAKDFQLKWNVVPEDWCCRVMTDRYGNEIGIKVTATRFDINGNFGEADYAGVCGWWHVPAVARREDQVLVDATGSYAAYRIGGFSHVGGGTDGGICKIVSDDFYIWLCKDPYYKSEISGDPEKYTDLMEVFSGNDYVAEVAGNAALKIAHVVRIGGKLQIEKLIASGIPTFVDPIRSFSSSY